VARTHAEVAGALELATDEVFTLTARADRIDTDADGSVVIYDYKTGGLPLARHVDTLYAPQLPLEAAIAEQGGFAELGKLKVAGLRYIKASGRQDGGEEQPAGTSAADMLASKALEDLEKLVARFDDPAMAYEVKRRGAPAFRRAYDYDEYEQLARLKEWLTQEPDEDPR
jgi:ATP-dependent helicase/nuclease subunit B